MAELLTSVRAFDHLVELCPDEGSDYPPIAWGDHFFYYSTNGAVPVGEQPFATIVTKDYPDEAPSGLDTPGRYRVNIRVGRTAFIRLIGTEPRTADPAQSATEPDVVMAHPIYAAQGWVAIVDPGPRTMATVVELLRTAHSAARRRAERRRAG